MRILVIPDNTHFINDSRYGGAFKLINDNIHYLLIEKSVFEPITHDYTVELWFKLNHSKIVSQRGNQEYLENSTLIYFNPQFVLQCNHRFILVNNVPIAPYQHNQWHQICLTYGQVGSIASTLSMLYINGQLIDKNTNQNQTGKDKKLKSNQTGNSNNIVWPQLNHQSSKGCYIGSTPEGSATNRYLVNSIDNQIEWAIFRLYNKSLKDYEVRQNFLTHSHRFGLNMENPHPMIRDHLIAYFDSQRYNIENSDLPNLSKLDEKKNISPEIIYNSNMDTGNDVQGLSKIIAQLLSRNNFAQTPASSLGTELLEQQKFRLSAQQAPQLDIFQLKNNPAKMRNILMYFQQNPKSLVELIQAETPKTSDTQKIIELIAGNGSGINVSPMIKQQSLGDIQTNPLKLMILKEFFTNHPQTFVEVLSNANLNPNELSYILSLVKGQQSPIVIDTFDGQSIDPSRRPYSRSQYSPQELSQIDPTTVEYDIKQYMVPNNSRYVPPNTSQYMTDLSQYMPEVSQYMPNTSQYMPNTSQYMPNTSQYMPNTSQEILGELKKLRNEVRQVQNPRQAELKKEFTELNAIESQLQKLMRSDVMSDKTNQIQLFQLIKTFQHLKNNLLFGNQQINPQLNQQINPQLNQQINPQLNQQINPQLNQRLSTLDAQLKNMEKMCLHAPNVLGYVSDGHDRVGIIDRNGQID
jgi:hypothetical protein